MFGTVSSHRHRAFNVCAYVCVYTPQLHLSNTCDPTEVTFPPPPFTFLRRRAGGALHSLSLSPHPLIHLPPLCSVSLPPTAHRLLRPIITQSTSSLQLPWQQLCWAQVPITAHGHQFAIDHIRRLEVRQMIFDC